MMGRGSWEVRSPSDSRWNASGRALVGMFCMPSECQDWIEKRKLELGEEPPADLEWSYMKD